MKILIISRFFCEISAVETLAWKTFQLLRKEGHEVFFFATDRKPYYIENYEYEKFFTKDVYSTIEYIKNPISYYWNFEAYSKLKKMLYRVKPDIVHVNHPISFSVFKAIKDFGIPIVWTLHETRTCCPATTMKMGNGNICKEFLCKNQKYYNCLLHRCQNGSIEGSIRKMIRSYANYYSNLYKKIDLYIAPSLSLKNLVLEANLGIEEKNIKVISNFISCKKNNFTKSITKDSYFLFVGRIVEEKGIEFLLEAIKGLPKEIKFKIAGTGDLDNYVKNYLKKHNLTNVDFVGYVKQDSINSLYSNAIATIVPSYFFEIFGVINIESFINKTPVIGSNIGGIPEIVDNKQNGLIFEVGDVEMLKKHILTYWNDLDLAKKHGENGYLKTLDNYTEEIYIKNLLIEYKNILRNNSHKNKD